jgi:hypothetical protein
MRGSTVEPARRIKAMSRIKLTEQAALNALQGGDRIVEIIFASIGLDHRKNPSFVELRRIAAYGQALLLVEGRARELGVTPRDAAAALRRLVTPTAKEQAEAIERRQAIERFAGTTPPGALS